MEGWIKIHRKIEARERYTDANTFRVFFHLLINANHKDGRWQGHDIKRGQTIIGRKSLSEKLKLSEQQIRRAIFNLQNTGEITSHSTNRFTIVTIVNYGLYNDVAIENNQPDNQQTTSNSTNKQPQTRIIRNKEGKEKNRYGKFENVLLSDIELSKLQEMYADRSEKIETLSEGIESKGYKYKSHYATILSRDRKNRPKPPDIPKLEPASDKEKGELYVRIGRKKYTELFGLEKAAEANKFKNIYGLDSQEGN